MTVVVTPVKLHIYYLTTPNGLCSTIILSKTMFVWFNFTVVWFCEVDSSNEVNFNVLQYLVLVFHVLRHLVTVVTADIFPWRRNMFAERCHLLQISASTQSQHNAASHGGVAAGDCDRNLQLWLVSDVTVILRSRK